MKNTTELRDMSMEELNSELLALRKKQFNMRLKKANGALDKTHVFAQIRKTIAQVKTIMTEKVGGSDGK
jgi:large subunit ribosomal protein L29